jgi:hypothetical protein
MKKSKYVKFMALLTKEDRGLTKALAQHYFGGAPDRRRPPLQSQAMVRFLRKECKEVSFSPVE